MDNRFSSLKQMYKTSLDISGDKASLLNKSYIYLVMTYFFQALAFVLFYPFFDVLLNEKENLNELIFWFCLIVLISLFSFIFKWKAQEFHYSKEFVELNHELRLKLGDKIKNISLQKLASYRTGDLSSIIVHNVDDSILHLGVIAGMLLEIMIIPIVIVVSMLFIEPIIALVFILAMILLIPLYKYSREKSKIDKKNIMKAHSNLESQIIEYIQGLAVLKSLNQVGKNSKKLNDSILEVEEVQKKTIFKSIFPLIIMNTLIQFIFVLVLFLGLYLIEKDSFSIATLVSFVIIFSRIAEPLANFLAISGVLDIVDNGFKTIKELLNIKEFIAKKPNQKPNKFHIEFDNVSFLYENLKEKTLKNISFTIESNSLCAIVGESGSGKTTLSKLIMYYDSLLEGSIKIGGVNIENMTQKDLMSCISVVFQDVYLFDDTIYNNIKMGKSSASKEEIVEASQKAYCHDFIMDLENGYDTKVGEIGGALSGGQRQRISIARAILKDAPIVILDEISSSLDKQSEQIVQKAIKELIKSKTVIAISHNLSTIKDANKIIVLDKGSIVENGTHDNLLKNKNKYFEIYRTQEKIKNWN